MVRAILEYGADLYIDTNAPFSRHTRNLPNTNEHSKLTDDSIKALNKNGTVILPPPHETHNCCSFMSIIYF